MGGKWGQEGMAYCIHVVEMTELAEAPRTRNPVGHIARLVRRHRSQG
jgi:hypothetical protein